MPNFQNVKMISIFVTKKVSCSTSLIGYSSHECAEKLYRVYLETEIHVFVLSIELFLRYNRDARYLALDMRRLAHIQILSHNGQLQLCSIDAACSSITLKLLFPG